MDTPTTTPHDVDDTSPESKLKGMAKGLDQQLGKLPIQPSDGIKIAGMLMASAIRRYIMSRALTGNALNWRERSQVIEAALNDTRRFLRSRFAKTGEFTDG